MYIREPSEDVGYYQHHDEKLYHQRTIERNVTLLVVKAGPFSGIER